MSRRIVIAVTACWVTGVGLLAGLASPSAASTPDRTARPTGHVWSTISAGDNATCGVRRDHTLWCWGQNNGNLGVDDTDDRSDPTQVGTNSDWASVDISSEHTCGVRSDFTLWCWGSNLYGQLGLGDRSSGHYTPIQVGTDTDWAQVSLGYDHTCATRTDNTLWCWGHNIEGQVGLGKGRKIWTSPTQVGGSDWAVINASKTYSTCGVRTDHTLWCWGGNYAGQLGLGDTRRKFTPVQVGTDTDWDAVSGGYAHTCATRIDHTLWCWGDNHSGQLGLPHDRDQKTPGQVGTHRDWAAVEVGDDHTCATRIDHTLWCWGANGEGQLGVGGSHRRAEPTQVGTDSNWALVDGGGDHTCAIRTHKTLWCWGFNQYGQLGLGDLDTRRLPNRV